MRPCHLSLPFSNRLLSRSYKGWIRIHLCLREKRDEGMNCFIHVALCLWGQCKISAVYGGQKVVFAAQGRPSSLALIHSMFKKKSLISLLRNTQVGLNLVHYWKVMIIKVFRKISLPQSSKQGRGDGKQFLSFFNVLSMQRRGHSFLIGLSYFTVFYYFCRGRKLEIFEF